nr:hypothetical protein [Rickettsia endosymbiont of Ceutorhynchus assimilis]
MGNIDVRLYPDVQGKSKIIVEVSNKEEVLEKFEGHEEELGEDCELGNCCVYDAIEQGYFKRSGKLMRPEVISESNNKWAEHEESRRDSREEIARRHELLQDLRNIESNIVKKEKNFNIKTHLVDIFKTLSRFYEEKGDISKTDLANTAEKESKRLGLEGRYNWNELFSLEKKVPQNIEQKLPLSKDFRQNNLAFSMSDKIVKYPTERDGNCFFHAVFGSSNPDVYQTDKAQKMRQEWHKFLSQFESLSDLKMPKLLKERLSLVFCNVFPEKGQDDLYNGDLYKKYLNEINRQDYFIYIEEVPILASLANIEIEIYYTQKLPDKIKPNPDMINASKMKTGSPSIF